MKELIQQLQAACVDLQENLQKAETNKAAAARARKATIVITNVGKEFRKASVAAAKK